MATHTRQSQFRRHLSLGLFIALTSALTIGATIAGPSEDSDREAVESGYTPYRGEPFFLLSDAAYGSNQIPQVRLEVSNRDFSALTQYGGVDVVVYKIDDPLKFLKAQRNLHRIQTKGNYAGEGLANTLHFLWDDWYRKSRRSWQDIFSADARLGVTEAAPALKTPHTIDDPTEFENRSQFALLSKQDGYQYIDRFRYPVTQAQPIQPPAGVHLQGSSSNFNMSPEGNVYIPLGKKGPGLYLVEAIAGKYRANTIVFVSDTIAITKTSSNQMLVWTAQRDSGAPVSNVQLLWTDGVGVLAQGATDTRGIAMFNKADPEKSYVIGRDAQGGVFISENFYYDSEIYNAKIYAVTDRPLYRPGDAVFVKFAGRQFISSRESQPLAQALLDIQVLDPNGTPIMAQKLSLSPQTGAQTQFRVPEGAVAGGYEIRYTYKENVYGMAFRVAEYIKPHFEIHVQPAKPNFKTNEPISGELVLRYPDGQPVKSAKVQLTVRAQTTTMVEGEMRYTGLFPVKIDTEELETNDRGVAPFKIAPAKNPSRYVLSVFASDGAAYRVKTSRELLVERSASAYTLATEQKFGAPNTDVRFTYEPIPSGNPPSPPIRYEIVQLETQTRSSAAPLNVSAKEFTVKFAASGSYSVFIYDLQGNIVGSTNYWVIGSGVKVTKGSIEIVLNRAQYKPGDVAEALITFPELVDSALLTLERDRVEQTGLIQKSDTWITAQRIGGMQWRAKIPVNADFAPNITFSVAYIKNGEWVFQNQGILVEQPRVAVAFTTDKEVYQPGETVNVQLETTIAGKPVPANLHIGVVDEMIYVLQPEIAPDIFDFFYHPRRNNVRTHSSVQFISYDLASNAVGGPPARGSSHERGVKVLERPRRENIDTAFWNGDINTDATGRAKFSFVMPDSLTRWRITGRAMTADGLAGQRTAYVRSEKPFYAKWISPDWRRAGDAPIGTLAIFNQKSAVTSVVVTLSAGNVKKTNALMAKPGINTLNFPLGEFQSDSLRIEVFADNKVVDVLDTPFAQLSVDWKRPQTLAVAVRDKRTPLALPSDATNVRVSFANSSAANFLRIIDDIDDYPYGCVEQTASRLLPLSLLLQSLPQDSGGARGAISQQIRQRVQHQRLRLVYMAGPKAVFGWWGDAAQGDLLLTAYAYYADYVANRVLGLQLPAEHWESLLASFNTSGATPALHRALALWMAADMGLPAQTLARGLFDDLNRKTWSLQTVADRGWNSPAFVEPENPLAQAMTLALAAQLANQLKIALPKSLANNLPTAIKTLQQSDLSSAQALALIASDTRDRLSDAERILDAVRADMPTFDRAMTLVWLNKVLGSKTPVAHTFGMEGAWRQTASVTGGELWRFGGKNAPTEIALNKTLDTPVTAYVQYDSAQNNGGKLAVKIARKLFHMTEQESKDENNDALHFAPQELEEPGVVRANDLYLEEITLTPVDGTAVRYGIVEAPLPPGSDVENTTWGIHLADGSALEKARHQAMRGGYAVPVEKMSEPLVVRHLLRFSQRGKFNLPAARFYSMYAPRDVALEETQGARTITVK